MNLSKMPLALTGCFLVALLPGCLVVAGGSDDPDPIPAGDATLIVDVTIQGSDDPALCDALVIDEIDINITDDFGDVLVLETIDCRDFGIVIDNVPEGVYTIETSLVADGQTVSDILTLTNLQVRDGEEKHVTTDFPASSID
jgi:hypothetical protein